MIVEMTRVRMLAPKAALGQVLASLQDLGIFHPIAPRSDGIAPHQPTGVDRRRRRNAEAALADTEAALAGLARLGAKVAPARVRGPVTARVARVARRVRTRVEALCDRERDLVEERAAFDLYRPLMGELDELYARAARRETFSAYLLLLRGAGEATLARFRRALDAALDGAYELRARPVEPGTTGLVLLVPAAQRERVDALMAQARLEPMPMPPALAGQPLLDALPRLRPRLAEIDREVEDLRTEAKSLARDHGRDLIRGQCCFHDLLLELDAEARAGETAHASVVEGWVPAAQLRRVQQRLDDELGPDVVVDVVGREEWVGDPAPVVLRNPRLFAPFERLTGMLPLPRYGSLDPTPFMAVFFPMLFGVVLGDVGYGLALGGLSALAWRRSRPGTLWRDVARIAAPCALFTVIFGFLYGELLGDLGRRLGLRPLWFDREEAVVPFLAGAIALGGVHLLVGLIAGAISERRTHPRKAIGRGITALMLVLVAVALLATFELLPQGLFNPAIVALLVAFPILIAAEGLTAPLELLSMFGHVLSYARVMALGTASVMLAVVANKMVGAIGSAAVGVLFALLFHLVNFAIGLFSPAIHVLRLHYVEFFGTFYSPGGERFRPLTHWSPGPAPEAA